MQIVYPYNEILPKKVAHDVYIFDECAALANEGLDVALLCGRGSEDNAQLFQHYRVPKNSFQIQRLPIMRKNNPFNLSWNFPFFYFSQREIERLKPNWVFLSVRKQGAYHLHRKVENVRYLYEVHELAYYPYMEKVPQGFQFEQRMLEQADLITVTTDALKQILLKPPYSITIPIEIIPLAVKKEPLPPPQANDLPFTLMYIGQLYTGQGVPTLIEALGLVENVKLVIVGGQQSKIQNLKEIANKLGVEERIEFLGFVPPAKLSEIAKEAHAFVAPFDCSGRMPYVAHTKLFEYANWGRPIIAPKLPTVEEHFSDGKGVLLYVPESIEGLASSIQLLTERAFRKRLQNEIRSYAGKYSWEERARHYLKLLYQF